MNVMERVKGLAYLKHISKCNPELRNSLSDDIIASGLFGYAQALSRLNCPESEAKTFIDMRIIGAMKDFFRSIDPHHKHIRKDIKKLSDERAELSHQLGREPSVKELINYSHFSPDTVFELLSLEAEGSPSSLDECPEQASNTCSIFANPSELHSKERLHNKLHEIRCSLSERDNYIFEMYFINGVIMIDIANQLDISESRVSQLIHKIKNKLKKELKEFV